MPEYENIIPVLENTDINLAGGIVSGNEGTADDRSEDI